jgi:signal transduction histidine kinase
LPKLIDDVYEITKSLVGRKVQLVNLVKANTLPTVTADADRLIQIMYNLIGNAGECGS